MCTRIRAALAALAAALTLALAVSAASAGRLSYTSRAFRVVWTDLTFSESGGSLPITCPVTLEGSFHSATMYKVMSAQVAHISRAIVNDPACREGHATILRESLPWEVVYDSFSGTLPAITGVRYIMYGAAFQIEPGIGVRCLAQATRQFPSAGEASRDARGNIISLTPDSSLAIPVTGTTCPTAGIFSGSGEVYVLGTTTRVSLNLI